MRDNINLLIEEMKKNGICSCIIPTSDFHLSEYIPECFKLREWLSGFTGSAGTLVVTKKGCGLWTDGRYYLQAEKELAGSGIELFYASEKDCISPEKFLIKNTEPKSVVGIYGRVFPKKKLDGIISTLNKEKIIVDSNFNPFIVWKERPDFPKNSAFLLDERYSGEKSVKKIQRIRKRMQEKGVTHYIVSAPDAVMWLLNIRGNDILYTPVVLSYLLMAEKKVYLYADESKFNYELKQYLEECNVTLCEYEKIYDDIKGLGENDLLAADFSKTNFSLLSDVKCAIKDINDFVESEKCIKNKTEISNIKKAYIKENIALIKSFYEIYNSEKELDECDVCDIIEKHRCKNVSYITPSFSTIAAYGENAAIVHYSPKKSSAKKISGKGMLLIDTGGQYLEGTTDTTRVLIMGEISDEEAENYTLVLKGMLNLSTAVFPKGSCGRDIDILARYDFYKRGVDFRHGTGHGIGYMLCVHEGPQRISPSAEVPLQNGMTISNEPGIYIDGKHGVRIENHLLVKEKTKTEHGDFLEFETLNFCPIGTMGIKDDILGKELKDALNKYNNNVKKLYKKHLTKEEYEWLCKYVKEI